MQSDSPRTVVMMAATTVVSHHDAELAREPFTAKHTIVCITYTVVAKSQHCRVRCMIYHSPMPLQYTCKHSSVAVGYGTLGFNVPLDTVQVISEMGSVADNQ